MGDNNKDAIIASLKRKIKKLEEENKELKEQAKLSYVDIYIRICNNSYLNDVLNCYKEVRKNLLYTMYKKVWIFFIESDRMYV